MREAAVSRLPHGALVWGTASRHLQIRLEAGYARSGIPVNDELRDGAAAARSVYGECTENGLPEAPQVH